MDDDRRPIIFQSDTNVRGIESVFAVLFCVFVLVAVGIYVDRTVYDVWQFLRPGYEAVVEWRDILVDWMRSVL